MLAYLLLKRILGKDSVRTDSTRFHAQGIMRDSTRDSLNRIESFRVEALEPRILLSADPVLGEMARVADKAGWDDPLANIAAIVEVIDAVANQDAKAADIEVAVAVEPEVEWPQNWAAATVADSQSDSTNAQTEHPEVHYLNLSGPITPDATVIDLSAAADTIAKAQQLWIDALDASVTPANPTFAVQDLGGIALASYDSASGTVTIDDNAAGAGWFIDSTLADNVEYATLDGFTLRAGTGAAAGNVDLLTAVLHEIGHANGYAHNDPLALMAGTLGEGERLLLPTALPVSLGPLPTQLFYQVSASGGISAFSDAGLTTEILTTTGVTTLIGLSGDTDVLVGADSLFGTSPQGVFTVTGPNSGSLGFATDATNTFTLDYSSIGSLRGGNNTDTALYAVNGQDVDSVWDITSVNAGTLTSVNGVTRFENIGKLVGGTAADAIIYGMGGLLTHGFDDINDGVYEMTVGDFVTLSLGDGASVTSSLSRIQNVSGYDSTGAVVTLNNIDVVDMQVSAATLFAGSDGETYFTRKANGDQTTAAGLEAVNASFDLRFYRQAFTDTSGSGNHVWLSLAADLEQLTLINTSSVQGSIGSAKVLLNVASQGAVIGTTNTSDAVVLREHPAFTTATAEFASVTGTAALKFQEKSVPTSGPATYTDVAYFTGSVTLTKTAADVVLPSGTTVASDFMVFQLQNASAFIGTGVTLPDVTNLPVSTVFDTANAEGFLVKNLDFTLGLLKTQASSTVPSVIYSGMEFTTSAQAFGLPQIEIIARELSVKMNTASDQTTALDWTQTALHDASNVPYLNLSFNGLELLANVEIAIANSVSIAGIMELSVKTQSINDGAIVANDATVLTLKLSNGFFAAGTAGYKFDTNGNLLSDPFVRDTTTGLPTGVTSDFQGFYASGVGFELATVIRGANDTAGPESWFAFRATVGALDVVGLGGTGNFNIDGRDFLVTGNFASTSLTQPSVMNWKNLADDLTGPQLDLTHAVNGLNGLEQFKIGGTLTLEVTDALYLTSTFTMAVVADTTATAVGSVTGDLILLTLSKTTIFAGPGAVFADDTNGNRVINRGNAAGVYLENANLALGVLIDKGADALATTDDSTYIGLVGGFDLAQLLGMGQVEAQANNLSIRYNVAIDANGIAIDKLDWTTIQYSDAATALNGLDSGIDFAVRGTLFYGDGFVYLSGTFSLATGGYGVAGGGLSAGLNANVTTFAISDAAMFAGVGGGFTHDPTDASVITGLVALADLKGATGFDATGVNAELAFVNEVSTTATTLRSWAALDVFVGTADLVGLPAGFTASTTNLYFRTNIADTATASKLNWNTLTLDGASFGTVTGLTKVANIDDTLNVAFGGSFRGAIDGTILLAGTMSGEIVTLADLTDLPGTVAVGENVKVMRMSVSGGYLFAGVGGSFTETAGVVDGIAAGGTGFAAQGLQLDLLTITQGQADPTILGTTQSWTGLVAGAGQLDVRGLDAVDIKAYDLEVRLNSAATTDTAATATKLDWKILNAADAPIFDAISITDPSTGIGQELNYSVKGAVELRVADNVLLFGGFGISALNKSIDDGNGITVTDASVLSLSVSGATLFAGAGGAFVYDGVSGRATALENTGTGFAVQDANLDIAIISQPSTATATTPLSWVAVAGQIGQADIRGIDGITAIARDVSFQFNGAATDATKLNWTGVNDYAGTRIGTIDQTLDLAFAGQIELDIQSNIIVSAGFSGKIQTVTNVTDGTITVAEAEMLQFNITAAYVFVGDGGAFTRDGGLPGGAVNGIAQQGTGFAVTNASLDLFVVNEIPLASAPTAQMRSWSALYATASEVAPRGLPDGLEIGVTDIAILINNATNPDGTKGPKLAWGTVSQFTNVPDVFDAGTDLKVSGTLTLNAFGFINLRASFDLQLVSGVTAQLDQDAALENAELMLLGLTLVDPLFVGQPGGVGISVGSGNVAVALLSAVPDAGVPLAPTVIPSATAITAQLGNATITGLPEAIDFNISELTLEYYTHELLSASDPNFDWTTVVVPDETVSGAGVTFNYGPAGAPLTAQFDADADRKLVSGAVTFSAFDFVAASATFSLAQDIVDVDVNSDQTFDLATDMDNATLTRIGLGIVGTAADPGLTIGIRDGPGFTVASADLLFASITSSNPTLDTRGYFGLKANIDTATLVGVPGIVATLNNAKLEMNSAASKGSTAPLDVLDWTRAVNFTSTEWSAAVAINTDTYDVFSATNIYQAPIPTNVTVLDLTRDGIALYGDATIIVKDFIHIRGEATLISEQNVVARTLTNAATFNTSVLKLGLANVVVFAGTSAPSYLTDATGRATAVDPNSNATGIALTVDSLGLMMVKEAPTTTTTAELRSWYAIKARGSAELIGVDNLVMRGTLNVAVNGTGTGSTPYGTLDFSDTTIWNVTVGQNSAVTFDDLTQTVIDVRGSVVLGVSEYVFVSGEFAFRKGDALLDVILADGQIRQTSLLTVGARNLNIFVGTGYDLNKSFANQTDLVGLQISDGFMGLALMQAIDSATGAPYAAGTANAVSYTALNAGGSVALVGVDGLTLAAYDFEVL
ncbi:hypothetical protein LCGC14_1012390, partial [marine sediment metagenome]